MCRCACEGFGFQAVYSSIGYINRSCSLESIMAPGFTKLRIPGIASYGALILFKVVAT